MSLATLSMFGKNSVKVAATIRVGISRWTKYEQLSNNTWKGEWPAAHFLEWFSFTNTD